MSNSDCTDKQATLPLCIIQGPCSRRSSVWVAVDEERQNWPTETDVCCWNCCHKFAGSPIPLALSYDVRSDLFHVQGIFCSWSCAKAYLLASSSYTLNVVSPFLTMLHRTVTGHVKHIVPAPPRQTLQMFGGQLSIEEFRAATDHGKSILLFPKNMVIISPNVVESVDANTLTNVSKETVHEVNFQGVQTNNDNLRLKRAKPLRNSKHTLDKAMGLSKT